MQVYVCVCVYIYKIHYINDLPHGCDKIPDKNNLRRKGLFLLSLRDTVDHGREGMAAGAPGCGYVVSTSGSRDECCCSARFLCFLSSSLLPTGWYCSHLGWVFLPQLNPSVNVLIHSGVFLNPIKKISQHTHIFTQRQFMLFNI